MKSFLRLLLPMLVVFPAITGCLKDKDYDNGSIQSVRNNGGSQNIIEIQLTSTSVDNFLSLAFDAVNKDTVINVIPVVLASPGVAAEDINVTLKPNPALVDAYNNANGTAYQVPTSSMYTVLNANNVVTIPKGSRVGYLQVKLNPNNFVGDDWAFGYEIASVDKAGYTVSGNLNQGIFAFGIKNKYDGHYIVDGTFSDILAPANNPTGPGDPYPYDVYLITTSGNSVTMYVPGTGYFHLIAGGSVYGEFDPVFTFNSSDQITSVTNLYGQPSPTRGRSAEIDPTGLNKQNADRSIDVKYIMKQAGATKTLFSEHLTYVGPR